MKKYLLLMLWVVLLVPFIASAQTTVTFGTGTAATTTGGSAGAPMSAGTIYSYTQNLYTEAELTAAGVTPGCIIIGIAFYNGTNTNTTMNNISTYMGHRASASFSSTSDNTPYNQLQLVDSSNWVTTGSGPISITLQNPFIWDGANNLVIGVAFAGATSSALNCGYNYTEYSDNRQWRRYLSYSTTGSESAADPTYTGTSTPSGVSFSMSVSPRRPNLQITYINSNCPSPAPRVANIGPYSAELNWNNFNQSAISWDVLYGEANSFDTLSGGTLVSGITDTFYHVTTLNPETEYQAYLKSYCSTETGSWSPVKNFTSSVTCPVPSNITVTDITTDEATINFEYPASTATAYVIEYNANGLVPGTGITEMFYDFPIVLQNLNPATNYYFRIRTDCSAGDTSYWSPIMTFRTSCPEYLVLPFTESFDGYGGTGQTYFPTCWTRLTNYTSTNYPYISTSYSYTPTSALYFYATTSYYSIAIAPEIDVTVNPINTLGVSFNMLKTSTTSTYGKMQIGVMTDPTNASTFVPVATINPTDLPNTTTWYDFDVVLNSYTGSGSYIAFRAPADGTNYVYLDNVTIYTAPSCLKPLSVTTSNITHQSVTLNWTPRNGETEWEVAVVPHGVDPETVTPEYVYSRPYTVEGLMDNTQYDAYVRAYCIDGEYSVWSSVKTFYTACLPTDVFPYSEDFDNCSTGSSAALPNCWEKHTNYTTAYPYPSSSYHASGTNAIYFYSTSTYYSYMTSQGLDLSQYGSGTLMLSCKTLSTSTSYGRLNIGYMTDPDDLNTFVSLKSLYSSDYASTGTWYERQMVLTGDFSAPIYLAFVSPAGGTNYVYVDDVQVDFLPDCSEPSDLEISQILGTSALVSWTASPFGALDYNVEYSEAGLENWTLFNTVTGTQAYISGLLPGTAYDVRVSANCSNSMSEYITGSFITGCLAGGNIEIGNGTNTGYYIPVNNYYNYSYTQQIFDVAEMGGPSTLRGIKFQYAYSSPTTDKTNVTIYLAHTTQSTFSSTTSWIPISTATQVYTGNLNCTSGWNTFNFTTPFNYNGTDNLVLIVDDNSGGYNGSSYTFYTHSASGKSLYYQNDSTNPDPLSPPTGTTYGYRNNVVFLGDCDSVVACVAPNVMISNIDDQSVTLDWVPGNDETAWDLEYKLTTESTWTSEGPVYTAPYTITGLTPSSDYQVRIRSNCSSDYSTWITFSFTTECEAVSTLPLIENFESATGSGAGNFISCWTRNTNYSTAYPYTSNAQKNSGTYSLYFYGTTTAYSYAASPRFDESIEMDSLLISLYLYKTSAAYFIEVGIMDDPNDYSTFFPVATLSPSVTSGWEYMETTTRGYNGTGRYVAFRIPQWATSYMYIDDISIQYIPFCTRIENLVASNVLSYQADINWIAGGSETEWEYLYAPSGTIDFDNDIPEIAYTNSVQLTNLLSNTMYDVYVRARCSSDDYSTWLSTSFRTACDEVTALPFIENFDTYGTGESAYPTCWGKINTYSSNRPYVNATAYEGAGSLYFYAGTSGTYNIAVLPPFATSIPVNTLQLKFQYRTTNATDRLVVGVMTDPTNASTFVPVETLSNTATATWFEKRVYLDDYTGTGQYIAFKCEYTTASAYAYIDNLEIDLLPACSDPFGLGVSNLTGTSADIVWQDDPSEGQWEMLIVPASVTPDFSNAFIVTSSPYSATDLAQNTVYDVYLRTACSNGLGYSNWVNTRFMTISSNPAQVPYFHDFSDETENAEWAFDNGSNINKWYIGSPSGVSDTLLFISSDNGITNAYDINSTSISWAYRDVQFGPGAEFTLDVMWRAMGESCCDYINIYMGAPMQVPTGTTVVAPDGSILLTTDKLNQQSTWQNFSYVLDASYANTTQRIYFMWRNDGSIGTTPSGAIGSVSISVNDCGAPHSLAVTNIATTTADLSFTPALASDMTWEYVIGTGSINPNSETPITTTSNSLQLTGLNPATSYTLYVRTVCDNGGYSSWSPAYSFFTDCAAVAIPYSQSFDNFGTGSSTFPNCWERINTYSSNYPYISTTYVSSPGALYFYAGTSGTYNIAVTPEIDLTNYNMSDLQVTFQYRPSNATSRMIVGVMTNPLLASTFVPIDTVSGAATTWAEHTVYFNNYTGTGAYIAFKNDYTTTTGYGYLDDVVIDEIPSCPAPVSVSANNIDMNSATLSWNEVGGATSWNIIYGEAGFDMDAGQGTIVSANSNPFTLTGLLPSTHYDVYVQSDCGAGDVSAWSHRFDFSTDCDQLNIPYTENFESYTGTTYTTAGPIPACWANYTENTSYPAPHITSTTAGTSYCYPNSGTNCLTFTASSAGTNAIAILPEFSTPLNQLQISFYYRMESTSYGTLYVGYVTNTAAPATSFTSVATIPNTTTITAHTVSFVNTSSIPAGARIAFKWDHNSTYYSCGVDDIEVDLDNGGTPVTCDTPTGLTANNITTNSTLLNWSAGGTENAWNVQYKLVSATSWGNSISVNTTNYNITGLTPNTAYMARVQAVCDASAASDWTTPVTFTTLDETVETCPAPTNLTATDVQNESITLTWNQEANTANNWTVNYRTQGATAWNSATATAVPYTLTGLTGLTTYEIQVIANCTNGLTSDPSNTITATTTNVGVNEHDLDRSVSVYPNPTAGQITITAQSAMESVCIYDVYGKLISTQKVEDTNAVVEMSGYAAGVYFAKITTAEGIVTKRIVKR